MALLRATSLLILALSATSSTASGISYITDIPAFTSLAPCAASAVSYAVQGMTRSQCPPDETALESCACTKDSNAAVLQTSITSWVLYSCSSTATDDVASASSVFSRYCHQDSPDTNAPGKTLVSQYITDINAYSALAPCAQNGLSYAVMRLTEDSCPPAASALASCACFKNQYSAQAMTRIKTEVQSSCGTTHTEDVTSAQAIFAGYCGMNTGVTSFPAPPTLAGSLSYYITDLPNYSSLAPCAASALSEGIMYQTSSFCAADPNALVSCVCTKDKNQQFVSSAIASGVGQSCSSTATEDVSSALAVFDFYCSAGNGLVVPTGVIASATATRGGGRGTQPTGSRAIPKPTASSTSPASAADGSSSSGVNVKVTSSGSKLGLIVGSVVGGLALIIIAVIVWFCLRRRSRRRAAPLPIANSAADKDTKEAVELHRYSKMSSPVLKEQDLSQHVSEMQGSHTATSPYPSKSELESPGGYSTIYPSNKSELASPGGQSSLYPANKSELPTPTGHGQYPQYPPAHPQEVYGRPLNQAHDLGYNPARLNEGPVYEMYAPAQPR